MVSTDALSWWHVIVFFITVMFFSYLAEKSRSQFMTFTVGVGLILVNGLRHGYIDTRGYRLGFETLDPSTVLNFDFLINGTGKDKGFTVINAVIRQFTDNGQVFLLIMGAITVGCLFFSIVHRTPEMTLAVFLFICTGCYLDTMNGLRQALVSALLFALLPKLLIEKKFLKYLIVVLILSTVHASALLFIPLYFIADSKAWSKSTWVISISALVVFLFFNSGIGNVIVNLLEGTSYGNDYGEMLLTANTSVNVIRVVVAAVPLVLSYIYRYNEDKNFPMYNIAFNMSLINVLVWLFATKVLYFYRLAMYFQPYMILLLCYELYYLDREQDRRLYRVFAVLLFFSWQMYTLKVMGSQFFVGYLKY